MSKKILWFFSFSLITLFLFACGGGSTKEVLQRDLKLVGIPQYAVYNLCQDSNRDEICNGEDSGTIQFVNDGKYLLETSELTSPILLEIRNNNSSYFVTKYTVPFKGFEGSEIEKELSLLQSMVDLNYLTLYDIMNTKEMDNDIEFYDILLRNFEINLNLLTENGFSSDEAVEINLKEMANRLKNIGIADELPMIIDDCEDDDACIEASMKDTIMTQKEVESYQKLT